METIDVDALRDYMEDYYGTAMFNGFPLALMDLADVGTMDSYALCELAERAGVDLRRFAVEEG